MLLIVLYNVTNVVTLSLMLLMPLMTSSAFAIDCARSPSVVSNSTRLYSAFAATTAIMQYQQRCIARWIDAIGIRKHFLPMRFHFRHERVNAFRRSFVRIQFIRPRSR